LTPHVQRATAVQWMNRYASVAVAKGKVLREFGDEITIEASFKILNADPRKSLDDLYCEHIGKEGREASPSKNQRGEYEFLMVNVSI